MPDSDLEQRHGGNLKLRRERLKVAGIVQGVGFRPHVFMLAKELALTGWVRNDGAGVTLEIQGLPERLEQFVNWLQKRLPKLARIDSLQRELTEVQQGEIQFSISSSEKSTVQTRIGPDATICLECLSELFDSSSRFYLYPFLNCTHCGPRYTITESLPYDRSMTTMRVFSLCDDCNGDYNDPLNRRFHAQPTACPNCGPRLSRPLGEVVQEISDGKIIGMRSLGGFHLVCDATNDDSVQELRRRKHRDAKPFAIMVLNSASANQWCRVSESEEKLLDSVEHPIVLLQKREVEMQLSPNLAPRLGTIGVMLPYTPLHFLLFYEALGRPIGSAWLQDAQNVAFVMTSANISGEPLVTSAEEAAKKLSQICDTFLSHERDIVVGVDDSVVASLGEVKQTIRRARGYAPASLRLKENTESFLACGSDLKNTFAITRGAEVFLSQYLGDLDTSAGIKNWQKVYRHMTHLLEIHPMAVAVDLHPDFQSTQLGRNLDLPTFAIQHHHAHIAAVMAEYHLQHPVLGLALDGFGLGPNQELWGGELLLVHDCTYQRLGSLKTMPLPGGDFAAKHPWRVAVGICHDMGAIHPFGFSLPQKVVESSPRTSSCGRLFDAVSSCLGICHNNSFEGAAAMYLETEATSAWHLAFTNDRGRFFDVTQTNGEWQLSLELFFREILSREASQWNQTQKAFWAAIFHKTLAEGLYTLIVQARRQYHMDTVCLAGGCMHNRLLAEYLSTLLKQSGLKLFIPRDFPPNDAAISLGQAFIMSTLLNKES